MKSRSCRFGNTISNCADFDAVYDPAGANTPVNQTDCQDFTLSGPFTQHARFDTTVRFGAEFGVLDNTLGMTQNDPTLAQRCGTEAVDELDLDGDSSTVDVLCTSTRGVDIAPIAQLVSQKEVQGLCDTGFTNSSAGTLAGGSIDYRLSVTNVGTIPMEDFVIIDILPFVGDTGVLDLSPLSSLWMPILVAPITPPPGTTLFYSTTGNPCRPEVGGPTTGCDPPNWSTVPPVPISDVRSFKVEFGSRVVGPADQLQFEFQVIAPGDLPGAGSESFNSFAYLGERSDGFGSLSAEPNKVGMAQGSCPAAALGDFVWVDTDGDGTQNDGTTGLHDVFVELFQLGLDGIPILTPQPLPAAVRATASIQRPDSISAAVSTPKTTPSCRSTPARRASSMPGSISVLMAPLPKPAIRSSPARLSLPVPIP